MLRFDAVTKTYLKNGSPVHALEDLTIAIAPGEFVLVKGPSGCGKSTLLLSAGGMLRPSAGRVLLEENDLYALSGAARSQLRAARVGFVFQMLHLIPYLTVRENILAGFHGKDMPNTRIDAIIDELGLNHRARHRPAELSAGEKQRAALARAFVGEPPLILADEPTGNLDPGNAQRVMEHLHNYHQNGATVLMVTHGADADPFATRTLTLHEGRLKPPMAMAESNAHG
ncbi:MAG: ABC transporter ATP-binding protein [Candidatus Hydrogenedentota bacterium]